MKLELKGVTKSFGAHRVLDGIEMSVADSEVICLIGASGSGKSTLLRCVNLLEPIDDGEIWLDGEDISEPRRDPDAVRRRIGMVFQSYNLFPHLSLVDNVALGPRKVLRLSKRDARERAAGLLARLGLSARATAFPDQCSGGQQQRAAIARSLAMQPEVMLLDEITSALDPELVGEVLDVVRELKSDGMTMLMATHEMAFAAEIADRVVFLDAGRIAESGPTAELFGNPREPRTRQFLERITSARPL